MLLADLMVMTAWCITPIIAVIFFAVMILWMASIED